ncbi:MAG: AMP-binding protein, partial [Rubrivivax sp.]|nr:AMP-binding protein [Rubrivivax sp.]
MLIGSTRLAIVCAQHLIEQGHRLIVALPLDSAFANWCQARSIPCAADLDALNAVLDASRPDWLFSAVNSLILPPNLIAKVRQAFNYHDAPLPRYAGTHATSWAILQQENHYAVTWHQVAATVDAGGIAVQTAVAIESVDTALTLNLKCVDAAVHGFKELLTLLGAGPVALIEQDLSHRSFFGRWRRPNAMGLLCWTDSAEQMDALVRALDFGAPYDNPLGKAKLLIKDEVFVVERLHVGPSRSTATPGTVLAMAAQFIRIATGSLDVEIRALSTLEGVNVVLAELCERLAVQVGSALPVLEAGTADCLTDLHQALAPFESRWAQRLAKCQPTQAPPILKASSGKESPTQLLASAWLPLEQTGPGSNAHAIMAAFLAVLSRMTAETEIHVGLRRSALPFDALKASPWSQRLVADVLPLNVRVDPQVSFIELIAEVQQACEQLHLDQTYCRDLFVRYPAIGAGSAVARQGWSFEIEVVSDEAATDREQVTAGNSAARLQVDEQGHQIRWVYDASIWDIEALLRLGAYVQELLHNASSFERGMQRVPELDILPPQEREQLLVGFNQTEVPYPEGLVHELFEAQVRHHPEATAVVCGQASLSYGELNQRANQVAHRLIELGVQPDDRVAICVQR